MAFFILTPIALPICVLTSSIEYVDLSGEWKIATINPELNRSGTDVNLDDSKWSITQVPGHWGNVKELENSTGPVLYRKSFTYNQVESKERTWLHLDGVTSQSEVWLDGHYLGETVGYFVPHKFDISEHVSKTKTEHLLAIEVSCPDQSQTKAKHSITGSLQHGPLAPSGSPGGIWKQVRIGTTRSIAIQHARMLCTKATPLDAEVAVRLVLDCEASESDSQITTKVFGPDGSLAAEDTTTHTVALGENRLEWKIPLANPQLWWPASLGEQPLYRVEVKVSSPDGLTSDSVERQIGLRSVEANKFVWKVNGKQIFVKAIAMGPKDRFLAGVAEDSYLEDVQRSLDCGLDMLRVYGHVSDQALYEAADKLGLLIWQDFPLVGTYATGARKPAKSLVRSMVDHLGHHPSVVVWCCHDDPSESSSTPSNKSKAKKNLIKDTKAFKAGRNYLPSWNRSVFDPVVRREVASADDTRPIVVRSGELPSPINFERSDTNLWLGWRSSSFKDLSQLLKKWPRLGEFPGGIGSQSVAIKSWGKKAPQWHGADSEAFDRYVPRSAYPNGRSWANATRTYQADLLKAQIETIRRLKYHPSGGFCVYALNDAHPDGGFGIVDKEGKAKPALKTLTDACQTVLAIADYPPTTVTPGQTLKLKLHAVNDSYKTLKNVTLQAQASAQDWQFEKTWVGDLTSDSCTFIGTFKFVVPNEIGQLEIQLQLMSGEVNSSNHYTTVVIPVSETL